MKQIRVIAESKNKLVLDEDAQKGDWIDLAQINSVDTGLVEKALAAGADKVYQEKLKAAKSEFELHNQKQIAELQAKISSFENEKKLAVAEALSKKDSEISELKQKLVAGESQKQLELQKLSNQLENAASKAKINEDSLKQNFESQLKLKDEQIAYYKDLKAKMSTKMIGESLEVHCKTLFEQFLRPVMPSAYFERTTKFRARRAARATLFFATARMALNTFRLCSR